MNKTKKDPGQVLEEKVLKIICEELNVPEKAILKDRDIPLRDILGMSSLDALSLELALEEALDVTLDDTYVKPNVTFDMLLIMLRNKL